MDLIWCKEEGARVVVYRNGRFHSLQGNMGSRPGLWGERKGDHKFCFKQVGGI